METSELFTDPLKMKDFFQQQLPGFSGGECIVNKCQVLRFRYHREKNTESVEKGFFTVRYELEVKHRFNRQEDKQLLFAKVYPKARRQEELRNLRTEHSLHPRFAAMVLDIPDLDMIVWSFPNDPGISHLAEIMNPDKITRYLPFELLPQGVNGPGDITDAKLDVIRYHPEVRCTFHLNLICRSSELPSATHDLYGKTFNDERGEDLYRLIRFLWMKSIKNAGSFIIAQPLAYNSRAKILWQETLSGKPLGSIIGKANCKDFLWSVAGGLAWIHKSSLTSIVKQGTFDQLEAIVDKTYVVMSELPRFREQLELIVSSIKKDLPGLAKITDRPVHGSFRIKELLVCEKGLAVFDLDKVTMGDWVRDLALFLVDLHLVYRDADLVHLMSGSFYRSYCSQVDWEVPVDRLKWHIQVQYLKRVYWIYRNKRLDPRLETRIQKVITLIQKGIDF